ncbi:MAG: AbrB/MazE/SpoVT family DNA-binding domain-containing protein [Gemmatimonadetes bacterium]|nr:AbrB/MazE/SpoVT family DNA-binding domain-containing protein [Gemmatimonadota bacterium]
MRRVTITAKRQATLPRELCEELGVGAGDQVQLERRTIGGEALWVLHGRKPDWSWFAAARRYGLRQPHRWSAVEKSIARGFALDHRA